MNASEILVWNQIQHKLKSFVIRYTRDKALAEDIIHDVFLKVHAKVGQLKDPERMVSWIFQITRNTIADSFRGRGERVSSFDIDSEEENRPLSDCVSRCLLNMMTTLPEKYRYALELIDLKDFSQLELAKELNISYSGAKSRVQRARKMLKEKMNEAFLIKFDSYGNVIVCESKIPCSCC